MSIKIIYATLRSKGDDVLIVFHWNRAVQVRSGRNIYDHTNKIREVVMSGNTVPDAAIDDVDARTQWMSDLISEALKFARVVGDDVGVSVAIVEEKWALAYLDVTISE